jgi:hypothetical protein
MDWATGLPTGTSCNHPGGSWPIKVPAEVFAWRMREMHYSTLSLRHGYSHLDGNSRGKVPQPNNNETIDHWMRTPLNLTHLYYDKLPVSPDYAAWGNHTGYEYLRDHLGYRLELQTAEWPAAFTLPATFNFTAALRNWGFAAPVNPRPVHLVILSADKTTVLWQSESLADPRDWQPHTPGDPFYTPARHTFGGRGLVVSAADLGGGCAMPECTLPVGLFMPDARADKFGAANVGAAFSVRLANADVGWAVVRATAKSAQGGVNLLGEMKVHVTRADTS